MFKDVSDKAKIDFCAGYKTHHLIENFFAKLKQLRAIATRYDQRATNFLGGIFLAASVALLA